MATKDKQSTGFNLKIIDKQKSKDYNDDINVEKRQVEFIRIKKEKSWLVQNF